MGQSDVLGWLVVVLFASLGERFVVAQDCARIAPSNGAVDTQNVTNGAIATITCDPCHEIEISGESSVTLTCVNGVWISSNGQIVRLFFCTQIDDVECDSLAPLPDHVSPIDDREPEDLPTGLTFTAQLKCDEGYNLTSGNLVRTCECDLTNPSMGQWSGSDPVCSRIYCSSLGTPENGSKSTNETEFGTNVKFLCDDGFILSGDPELTCESGDDNQGRWSGSVPQCVIVKCPNLIDPSNGYILGNGTRFGDVLSFGCMETFRLVGNRSLECQANAQWNASTPTCEKITCTIPPINNGSVIGISDSEANISSVISFICDEGFDRNGSGTIQCEASGFWNETEPGCIIRTCPELTAPRSGSKDSNASVYGTVVTFMCDQGYALQGNDSLTCLASGQWDGSEPSCSLVTLSSAARPMPTETIRLSTLSSAEFSFLKEGSVGFQSSPEVLKTSSSIASSTVIQSLAPSVEYTSNSKSAEFSSRRSSLLGEASLSVGLQFSSEVLRQSSVLYQTSPSSEKSVKASSIAPSTVVIQSSRLSMASDSTSAPSLFTARATPTETIRLSPVDFSTGRFSFSKLPNSTSLSGSTLRAFLFQTSSTVTGASLFPSAVIQSSGQPESALLSDSNQVALSTFVPLPSVSAYEISTSMTARQESVLEVQASSQEYSQGIESSALLVSSAMFDSSLYVAGSSPGVDLTSFGPSETSAFLSSTTFDPTTSASFSPTSFLEPSSPVSDSLLLPESSIAAFHQVISSAESAPDSSAVNFQSESQFLSSSGVVSNSFPVPSFLVPSITAATSTTALVPTPMLPSRSERASEFFSLNPSIVSSIDVENVFTINPSPEFEMISSSAGRMTAKASTAMVIASSASIETGVLSASSRIDVEVSSSSVAIGESVSIPTSTVGESATSTLIFSSEGLPSATSPLSLETISSKDLVSPTSTVAFLQGLTSTSSFDIVSSEGFSSKVTSISSLETISSKDLPLQSLTSTSSFDIVSSEGFLSTTAKLATAVTSTPSLETISSKELPLQSLTSTSSFDIVSSEGFPSVTSKVTSTSSLETISSKDFAPEDLTSTPSFEITSSDRLPSVSGVQATALPSASFPVLNSVYVPSSATIPMPTLPSFRMPIATTTLVVEPPPQSSLSTRFPLTRTVTPTVSIRATSLASLRTVTIDSSQFSSLITSTETVASTQLRPSRVVVFQSSDSLPLLNVSSSLVEFLEPSSTPALVSSSASSVSSALSSASTFQSIMSSVAEPETLLFVESSTQLPLETTSFLSSRFSSVVAPEPSSSSVFISTTSSSIVPLDFSTSFSSVFISALSSSSIASSQFSIGTATSSSSSAILPADFSTSLLSSSDVSLMVSLRTSSVIPTAVEPTLPPASSLVSTAVRPANNSALSSAVAPTIPSISGSTLTDISSEFLLRSTSLAVSFPVQMTSSFDVPDPSSTGLSSVDVREVSSTGFLFSSSSIVGTRLSTALESSSVFAEAFFSSVSLIRSSDDQIPVATSTASFSSSLDIAGTSSISEFSSLPFSSSSLTSSFSSIGLTISSEFFDVVSSSSDVGFAGISSSIFTSSVRVSAELSTPIPIVNSTIIPISSFDDLVPSTTIFSSSSHRFVVSSTAAIVSEVSSTSITSSGAQSSISLEPSPTIVAMFSPSSSTIIGFVSLISTAVFDTVSLPTLSTTSSFSVSLFPPVIDFPTKTIASFSSPPILSSSLGRFPDVSSSLLISSDAVFVQTSSATILSRIRTSTSSLVPSETILPSQIVDFVSSIAELSASSSVLSPIISSSSFESSLTVSSALIPPSSSRFSASTFVFSLSFASDFVQSTSAVFPSFLSSTSQPGVADNSTVIASSLLVTSTAFLPVSSTSVLEPEATFSVRNFSSISSTASTFVFPSSSAELSVGITSSLSLVEPLSTSLQFFSTSATSSAVLETTSALAVASSTLFRLPMVLPSSSFVFPVLTSSAVRLVDFVSSTAAFSSAALMVNATETVPPTKPTPSFPTSPSTTNVASRNVSTTFPPTSAALVSSTPTFPTNATPGNVSTTSAPSSTAFPTNATAGNISTTSAATLVPSTPTFPTNATSGNFSTTSAPSSATLVPSTPPFLTNATSGNISTTSAPSSTVNATFPISTAAPAPSTPTFPSDATPGNVSATSATFPVNATSRSNVSTSPTVNATTTTDATTFVPSSTSGNVSTTSAPSPTANATSTSRFPTNATSGNISTASAVSPTLNATVIPALGNATTFPTISSTSASSPTVNATELRPTNATGTVSPASETATPTTTTENATSSLPTTEIPTNATEFATPAPTPATSMTSPSSPIATESPTTPTNRLPTTATSPANESTPISPTRYPPIAFWTELVFRLNFLDIHLSDLEWLLFMTSNLEEAYNEAKILAATVEKRRRREERPVVVTIINATTENQAENHAIVVFYVRDRGELIDAETVTNLLRLHEAQTINGIIGYEVVRINPYPYQAPTQLPITDDEFPLWAIVLIIVLTICLLLLLLLIICYCCWRSKYTDKVTLLQQPEYVGGKRLEEGSEPPGIELKHYNDILKEKLPPSQPIASWIEEDDDADDEADVEQRKIIVVESQDESSRDDVRKPLPDIRDAEEATSESPPGEYATIERSHVAAAAEISASLAPVLKASFPERRLPMIPLYRRVSVSRTSAETQMSLPATPKSSTASLSAAEPPPSKEEVEIRQELSLEIFRREEEERAREREEKEKAEAAASAFTEAQKKHIEQTMRQKADVERWRNKQRQRERHRQMEKEMKKKQDEEWRQLAEKKAAEKRRKERKERKEAQKELAGILDPEATQFEEITKRNIRRSSSKTRHWKKSTRSQIHPEIFHESPRSPVVWQPPPPPPPPPTSNHVVQVQPIPDSSPSPSPQQPELASPPRRRTLPTQPSHPPYDPRLGPRPPARSTMSRPKSASVVPYPTMGAPLLVQPRNERPYTAGAPPAMMHASTFSARPVASAWGEQQRVPGEQPVHVTPVYRTQSAQGHHVWNPYDNYRQSFQTLYSPSEPELSQPAAPPVYFPGSRSSTSMPQPQLPIQLGSRAPAPAPAPPSHVAPAPMQQPLVKAIQDELERLQRGRKIDHT
ncbi:streptococcal hemagglutinin-like isoform X2 [Oscarella lobularis]|uniref:streptococcal hemagglutinin-like isoform X2 n=1 Tax=Oscarella lobularis TaxID=121494 RepID=UPI0033144531